MQLQRNEKGEFDAYAWPGGYPIFYLCADNGTLCPDCANGKNGSEAHENAEDKQWRLVACDVHYEGEPITCDHCGASIESAYGPIEEEQEEDEPGEPSECDYVISDARGGGYAVAEHGVKHLGDFRTRDEAEDYIRRVGNEEQFRPNVWVLSDHGNYHLVTFKWD